MAEQRTAWRLAEGQNPLLQTAAAIATQFGIELIALPPLNSPTQKRPCLKLRVVLNRIRSVGRLTADNAADAASRFKQIALNSQ